ncbi:MAG: hypothetical protein LBB73_04350 [Dysgonamonadaceae bacterium]|jgi:hypothetical protein|nr:hypothetical protein [Dysgonamonadaceae bacterium]
MYRKSTFEQPDEQFLAHARTIVTQCDAHRTAWRLDNDRLDEIDSLTDKAQAAYAANSDKATRNLTTSTNKKIAFGELKHALGPFVDYLEANLSVPDEALAVMGLRSRIHHAHEPLPRPGEAPLVKVAKQHDEMTVYVMRAEHGHPAQSTTRKQYHGFKLRWRFEDETHYRTEVSTRLHHTLYFEREDETKRVVMAAAWINPRLEEGPWSEDVMEVVG